MTAVVPSDPCLYHIAHVDRLSSIIADGFLWCDAEVLRRALPGTVIGMNAIKERRLKRLRLRSHPDLLVGGCVPFYFCPRSVMLYLIHMGNHEELAYRGGQGPIVHLEFDLRQVTRWADAQSRRWAFTLSNAGSSYFEDRCDLDRLAELDWAAIRTTRWSGGGVSSAIKESKQAEFLVERSVPWELVRRIGVGSRATYDRASDALASAGHRPLLEIQRGWYY